MSALAVCELLAEDEFAIVLAAPDGSDVELLAHNIGASTGLNVTVNGWVHARAPMAAHICEQRP